MPVSFAVPIVSKEGIKRFSIKWFYELFALSYSSAVFFFLYPLTCLPAPTHSVALILTLDMVVSMQFSQVPIFVFCSPSQSVVFGCVGGIIPFLISSWLWLLPSWTSQVLVSQRVWQLAVSFQHFLIVRTYELVPEGIQVGPVESQRGWVNLLHWWSEKLRWAWQKVTKSRGRVKGSVHLWRHELLNENTYPAHLWRDRDQFPGCLVWLLW